MTTLPEEAVKAMPERIYAKVHGASTDVISGQRGLIGGWNEHQRDGQAEYVRADLAFLTVQGAVKKLEWVDADEGMCTKWRAAALGGHYELVDFGKDDPGFAVNFHWGSPLSFWFIQGDPDEWGPTGPKIFPTIDAAKAAAQADFEARILSAIEAAPPFSNLKAENARLEAQLAEARKALEPFALVAEHDISEDEADSDAFRPMPKPFNHAPQITVGHLRAARRVLEGGEGND